MSSTPTTAPQRIVPMLSYADAEAAIAFLCRAFGFRERYRLAMPDGRVGHAELELAGNLVYVAATFPELGLVSPRDLPAVHCQLSVWIDDVDAHCAAAREAGATIVAMPEDQFYGERIYRATDPEGNRWIFHQHLREVSVEDMQKHLDQAK